MKTLGLIMGLLLMACGGVIEHDAEVEGAFKQPPAVWEPTGDSGQPGSYTCRDFAWTADQCQSKGNGSQSNWYFDDTAGPGGRCYYNAAGGQCPGQSGNYNCANGNCS
jgi:hypothetical protein